MAGPLIAEARPPTVYWVPPIVATALVRKPIPSWVPKVLMIVPIRSEQNSPWAIAPIASMKYLFAETSMSFLFRNSLNLFMVVSILLYMRPFKTNTDQRRRQYTSFFADLVIMSLL